MATLRLAYALNRMILAAAVFLVLVFTWQQVYVVATAFAALLLAYAYLVVWGDAPVEERLV